MVNTAHTLTLNDVKFDKESGAITDYISNYKNIIIPEYLNGTPVKTIGEGAFEVNKCCKPECMNTFNIKCCKPECMNIFNIDSSELDIKDYWVTSDAIWFDGGITLHCPSCDGISEITCIWYAKNTSVRIEFDWFCCNNEILSNPNSIVTFTYRCQQ